MGFNEIKNTIVLAKDSLGYCSKINEDERDITEKLINSRTIIEKLIKQESGKFFNITRNLRDLFTVEFNSTYNAVHTTIKIQKEPYHNNIKFKLKSKHGYN